MRPSATTRCASGEPTFWRFWRARRRGHPQSPSRLAARLRAAPFEEVEGGGELGPRHDCVKTQRAFVGAELELVEQALQIAPRAIQVADLERVTEHREK